MADTSYVIEIASQVSGAAATVSELDSIADKMGGVEAKAAVFDDAIAKLTADLQQASAASAAANAAVAEGRSTYQQLETSAEKAAKAVEKLEAIESQLPAAHAAAAKASGEFAAAKAAGAAVDELKRLEKASKQAQAKLSKMQDAASGLDAARSAASAASAEAAQYAQKLDKLEQEAKQAAAAQGKLAHSLDSVRKIQTRVNDRLGDAASNLSTFRGALGDIGGPVAEFGERMLYPVQAFVDLREKFGRGVATMTVAAFGLVRVGTAVVGAILKITAALVVGVAALASYAIAASDAARKLAITREAAEVLTPALKGIPWDDITNSTGVAGDRLSALAKELIAAKVPAADLPAALRAIAAAESVLGAEGAKQFAKDMLEGKVSVEEFARAVDSQLGDKVARNMLSLEAQGGRFKRNISSLFNDFEIDPALGGLQTLIGMFDKTSSTGRFMSSVLHGIFDPIIDNAQAAAWVVEAFILGFMIGAVKLYTSLKPVINFVGKLIGYVADLLGIDTSSWTLASVLDAAAAAGEIMVPIFLAVAAAVAFVGAGILVVIGVIVGLTAALLAIPIAVAAVVGAAVAATLYLIGPFIEALGAAYDAVVEWGAKLFAPLIAALTSAYEAVVSWGASLYLAGNEAFAAFSEILSSAVDSVSGFAASMISAGSDLITGLINGIMARAADVIAAITGVVGGAVNAAKAALGISSPSKVALEIAGNFADTFSGRIDSGADDVDAAMIALAEPPALPDYTAPSSDAGGPNTSVSTQSSTTTNAPTIVIQNVSFPGGAEAVEAFQAWLERIALQGAAT